MARKDRTGNRKTREQRPVRRIPEMGYYLVVTDTEATERCFLQGCMTVFRKTSKRNWLLRLLKRKPGI